MMSRAHQDHEEQLDAPPPHGDDYIAPAPRVSVQAFCETVATATTAKSAAGAFLSPCAVVIVISERTSVFVL